jgi:ribosome maturation factor RimP
LLSVRGLRLYDVEHAGGVLRVMVEGDTGPDLGVIADVTRDISRALDDDDPIAGRYSLEVTSPGLERPLRTPDHYRKAVGERVKVKTHAGVEGERRIEGVLTAAAEDAFVVMQTDGVERRVGYDEVERVRTVFEWGPAERPGRGSKPGARGGKPQRKAATTAGRRR